MCLLGCIISVLAKSTQDYKGKVVDENYEPLIGVTVMVVGPNTGAITDIDGNFLVNASEGDKLKFSYIGFDDYVLKLKDKTDLNIVMRSSLTDLEEVVVTGYAAQKRSDISTAVASINMAEASKSGNSQLLEAMQGQISGVQIITDDGSPSGAMTFRIRGTNSLTGGTQPLFVIDGVPQPIIESSSDEDGGVNPLAGLNMDDVASVEVLKDAAASSIYGADGSNGVVIITTKTGGKGKAKVSVNLRTGVNIAPKVPFDMQTPEEYALRMLEKDNNNKSWQNIVENQLWLDPNNYTNWTDLLVQNSIRTDLSASVAGGSEYSNYMLSAGYQYNDGLIINNDFSRANVRFNLTQKIGKKAQITGLFSYSNTNERNPQQDGLYLKSFLTDPYFGKRELTEEEGDKQDLSAYSYRSPLLNIQDAKTDKQTNDMSAQLRYEHNILKGLDLTISGSISKRFYKYSQVMGKVTNIGRLTQGKITYKDDTNTNWLFLSQLRYNKTIAKYHNISAFFAFEMKQSMMNNFSVSATGFNDLPISEYALSTALESTIPTYFYSENQTMSLLGRFTYNYRSRYLLNFSLRRDGSSKFGNNNKFALFPSVSAAWRVEQENFAKNLDWLSSLKIRSSYGETGNNQIPSYLSTPLISNGYFGVGDGSEVTSQQNRIQNNDLKWETSREYNVGFDLGVFNNRLNFTADYYNKTISDMLLETVPPQSSGFSTIWRNSGRMRNKGYEFSFISQPIKMRDFTWTSNFNISFNQNKVLELSEGQYEQLYDSKSGFGNDVLLQVGMPVGIYFGYVEDGVYNTVEELENSPTDPNKYSPSYIKDANGCGRVRLVDTNSDGKIDEGDRVPIANVNPVHIGGWGHTFDYKNWQLYAFFRWSYGNDQINANLYELGNAGSTFNNVISTYWDESWKPSEPENNYKTALEVNDPYGRVLTTRYVEDGSFLRFQTLRLTYSLPQQFIRRYDLSKVTCSLTASNLALWTNYSGFDPEASSGWGTAKKIAPLLDRSSYPRPFTLLFSLDVSF